ncbi:MAG: hypothetical protein JSW23_01670 [Planctomycetota bacterium]|nr:MAG: hypothetical protein JSW23_01670 [Planctomycetota bacterium]
MSVKTIDLHNPKGRGPFMLIRKHDISLFSVLLGGAPGMSRKKIASSGSVEREGKGKVKLTDNEAGSVFNRLR